MHHLQYPYSNQSKPDAKIVLPKGRGVSLNESKKLNDFEVSRSMVLLKT
jgi:hypothetical protein